MSQLVLTAMLAVTVEALVEYGKSVLLSAAQGGWKTAVIQLSAAVVAVLLCLLSGADLFCAMGIELGEIGGSVLTGILIARGSNYLADFISRITTVKQS